MKTLDTSLIFAQNLYCGYTLKMPHLGSSNKYYALVQKFPFIIRLWIFLSNQGQLTP